MDKAWTVSAKNHNMINLKFGNVGAVCGYPLSHLAISTYVR